MALQQDLGTFLRGEDLSLGFTMTPLTDITGWTIVFTVKAAPEATTSLLSINATLTTPSSGIFTVPVTAAQTLGLSANTYAYDIWRTDSGSAAGLSIGSFTMKGSVKTP